MIGQKFGAGMLAGPLPPVCQPSSATPGGRKKRCDASQLPSPTAAHAAVERRWRFTCDDLDKIQQQLEDNLLSGPSSKNRPLSPSAAP